MLDRNLAVCALVPLMIIWGGGTSRAADTKVNSMTYYNNGSYQVDKVEVHWKDPSGNKKYITYNNNVWEYQAFCFNIDKYNEGRSKKAIPSGSEIWLKIRILLGDTKSCRKNNKFVYGPNVKATARYITSGTTLNNNQCHVISGTRGEITTASGNCKYGKY